MTAKGTIHQLFNIGSGPIAKASVPFSIDYVRCAGRRFGRTMVNYITDWRIPTNNE